METSGVAFSNVEVSDLSALSLTVLAMGSSGFHVEWSDRRSGQED